MYDYRWEDALAYLRYGMEKTKMAEIRTFATGATRDTDADKHDYRGYLSPIVLQRFGEYMTKHRVQSDGSVRDSDNWKKGMPKKEYLSSMLRHVVDVWLLHDGFAGEAVQDIEEGLCALFFNVQGYLHEHLMDATGGNRRDKTPEVRQAGFTSDLSKQEEPCDVPF